MGEGGLEPALGTALLSPPSMHTTSSSIFISTFTTIIIDFTITFALLFTFNFTSPSSP